MMSRSHTLHTSKEVSTLVRGWLQSDSSCSSPAVQSINLPPPPSPLINPIHRTNRLGLGAEKEHGAAKKKEEERSILFKKIQKRVIGSKKKPVNSNSNSDTVPDQGPNNQNQNESEDESCSKISIVSSSKSRKHKLESLKKQKLKMKRKLRKKKKSTKADKI